MIFGLNEATLDPASTAPLTSLLPSEFGEKYLMFAGSPFRIGKYRYMYDPMNDGSKHRHMVWARQCGKTLLEAICALAYTSQNPYRTVTIISSAGENIGVYEGQKLKPLMESPMWSEEFLIPGVKANVKFKELNNGSSIIMRGAFTGGARIRGISGDAIFIDELQHVTRDVVEEAISVMTRSSLGLLVTAGTQSHLDSPVNTYFETSDQKEWMTKCMHCNKWSDAFDEKNIGKKGPICRFCGGLFNLVTDPAQWVACNDLPTRISGYRFPLICLPDHPWDDIINKYENFSPEMFAIDVMARPYDFTSKPITESLLRKNCDENYIRWMEPEECHGRRVVVGIDYGFDLGSTTQICILVEVAPGKLKLAYCKKFVDEEADPEIAKETMARLIQSYNAQMTCADQGGQAEQNPWFRKLFGPNKFQPVMLVNTQKEIPEWGMDRSFWTGSKTKNLTYLFMQIKKGAFIMPAWNLYSRFGKEIVNETRLFNENTQEMQYKRPSKDKPDDHLHALNFATIAYRMLMGDFKIPQGPGMTPMFVSG